MNLKCQSAKAFYFNFTLSNVLENRPSDVIRNDHHAKFETSFFPNTVWGEKSHFGSVEVY